MPQAGKTYSPLKRDLPLLNIDGSIKLSAVLAITRKRRRNRGAGNAQQGRFEAVRGYMDGLREKIAADRSFWSVENKPVATFEKVQVHAWGRSFDDMVQVDDREAA